METVLYLGGPFVLAALAALLMRRLGVLAGWGWLGAVGLAAAAYERTRAAAALAAGFRPVDGPADGMVVALGATAAVTLVVHELVVERRRGLVAAALLGGTAGAAVMLTSIQGLTAGVTLLIFAVWSAARILPRVAGFLFD